METSRTNWLAFFLLATFGLIIVLVLSTVVFNSAKQTTQTPVKVAQASFPGKVTITKDGFFPATISVKKGSSVTWVNQDSKVHRVASDPYPTHSLLPTLDSGDLSTQDTYSFTYEKAGKFTYHDENNPLTIKGEVDVQ